MGRAHRRKCGGTGESTKGAKAKEWTRWGSKELGHVGNGREHMTIKDKMRNTEKKVNEI